MIKALITLNRSIKNFDCIFGSCLNVTSQEYFSGLIGDLCEVTYVDYINIKAFRHTYAKKKDSSR